MILLYDDPFQRWVSQYSDYKFIGGSQPLNPFPELFTFHSLGKLTLNCFLDTFHYQFIDPETNVCYIAKELDDLELRPHEARYIIPFSIFDYPSTLVFEMDTTRGDDYILTYTRVFIPTLNLTYIDPKGRYEIRYTHSGNVMSNASSGFYFNQPLKLHIFVNLTHILSFQIDNLG